MTDLSAAFNMVDHVTLLRKLEWHALRWRTLDLFESYLNNRLQFVEIDTFRSDVLHCLPCSSIQGSRFAGTLYNLYGLEIPRVHEVMQSPHLLKALLSQPSLVEHNEMETDMGAPDLGNGDQWKNQCSHQFVGNDSHKQAVTGGAINPYEHLSLIHI